MVAATKNIEPILADKAQIIDVDKVDPKRNYKAVIQLGANSRWRQWGPGKWEQVGRDSNGVHFLHKPAMVETPSLSGVTLQGLIVGHNKWVENNRTRSQPVGTDSTSVRLHEPALRRTVNDQNGTNLFLGDIGKQLLVVRFEETDEPTNDRRFRWRNQAQMIHSIVSETLEAVLPTIVKAIMDAGSGGSGHGPKKKTT